MSACVSLALEHGFYILIAAVSFLGGLISYPSSTGRVHIKGYFKIDQNTPSTIKTPDRLKNSRIGECYRKAGYVQFPFIISDIF